MSRTLGSFNRRVNLPRHTEDQQATRLPRIAALRPEVIPGDRTKLETGGEKFAVGKGRSGHERENRRYAGAIMNIDLRVGMSMPYDNYANLNYGAPGTVGQMYTLPEGQIVEKANADLHKRIIESTETGSGIKISSGMQQQFAPPLGGAAEGRTTAYTAELPPAYYYV